jgi:hypothetical protein
LRQGRALRQVGAANHRRFAAGVEFDRADRVQWNPMTHLRIFVGARAIIAIL